MGCCSAIGCSNSISKGFRLFRFPSNASRRLLWALNSGRVDWTPTSHSRLCEIHFTEDQFESNRLDSMKKLKPCAIPTIFLNENGKRKRKTSKVITISDPKGINLNHKVPRQPNDAENITFKSAFETKDATTNGKLIISNGITDIVLECDIVVNTKSSTNKALENNDTNTGGDQGQISDAGDLKTDEHSCNAEDRKESEDPSERATRYLCNIKQLEADNRKLKKSLQNLQKFFHKEQLESFTKTDSERSVYKWSDDCIIKCLKLKAVLGWDGYEYLLGTGYPGPSKSTLLRFLHQHIDEPHKDSINDEAV